MAAVGSVLRARAVCGKKLVSRPAREWERGASRTRGPPCTEFSGLKWPFALIQPFVKFPSSWTWKPWSPGVSPFSDTLCDCVVCVCVCVRLRHVNKACGDIPHIILVGPPVFFCSNRTVPDTLLESPGSGPSTHTAEKAGSDAFGCAAAAKCRANTPPAAAPTASVLRNICAAGEGEKREKRGRKGGDNTQGAGMSEHFFVPENPGP